MLKNLLLWNQWADFHETWYLASGTRAHHSLYKSWPWGDLDLFYSKVKFGDLGFCMGKSENTGYFDNRCSLGLETWYMHTTKWAYDDIWVNMGQGHYLTLAQGHWHIKLQTWFSQEPLGRLKSNFMWSLPGIGGMKVYIIIQITCSTVALSMLKMLKNLLWNHF